MKGWSIYHHNRHTPGTSTPIKGKRGRGGESIFHRMLHYDVPQTSLKQKQKRERHVMASSCSSIEYSHSPCASPFFPTMHASLSLLIGHTLLIGPSHSMPTCNIFLFVFV